MNEALLREHAYIIGMAASTMVELESMKAANVARADQGLAPAYGEKEFYDLLLRNSMHHNGILESLQRAY